MTPEERATLADAESRKNGGDILTPVVQAIRDAVREEREAIAKWHEDQAVWSADKACGPLTGFYTGAKRTHEDSAQAIRNRGDGKE